MKRYLLMLSLAVLTAGTFSCKSKKADTTTDTTTTTTAPAPTAPVEISGDEQLREGVKDATKDFPNVNASVQDGVITLTGSMPKDRFMTLKQSLDALRPKQVVNQLTFN